MQCRRPYINLGITQLIAGGGVVLVGITVIPSIKDMFGGTA